mmetsp:Transcript_4550/g.15079  ORF Transcript_4550/g.15079 Transcript_4550/m.15079 type:complete len:113 (+) Transcript_4550:1163-1501(+)
MRSAANSTTKVANMPTNADGNVTPAAHNACSSVLSSANNDPTVSANCACCAPALAVDVDTESDDACTTVDRCARRAAVTALRLGAASAGTASAGLEQASDAFKAGRHACDAR